MPVYNKEVANVLEEIANLLDVSGENAFRVRSYRIAARTISNLSQNITDLAKNKKDVSDLPGIGKSIAEKIIEYIETGKLKQLEELKSRIPSSLLEILKLEQLGPQRTKTLYEQLGIESVDELLHAAKEGKIEGLKGFGKKSSDKIIREIQEYKQHKGSERMKRSDAETFINPLLEYLKENVENSSVAGSYRRKKETVGDIDILATSQNPEKAMNAFVNYEEADRIIAHGNTKSSVKLRTGLQVDLRIVNKDAFGAALLYFTGSKAHNIALRRIGTSKNYKINEYGLFEGEQKIAGKSEKGMYRSLALPYIEPEIREDTGEIEAAQKNQLPRLIRLQDMKGDLQTHTTESDGKYSLEEMVRAAEKKGYAYYAVTDHSKRVSMANGLDEKRLAGQIEYINRFNETLDNIRVLKSIEVDILEDGSLDLADDILKELDIVVCSIHYHMNLPPEKQTARILKAMDNPHFNIFAHPTGRMINQRRPYAFDMEKVMKKAKENNCFLEINANPERLDLHDQHIRMAKEMGLMLTISTDAHSIDNLDYMVYGVNQARRGWLEAKDVLNTYPLDDMLKLVKG